MANPTDNTDKKDGAENAENKVDATVTETTVTENAATDAPEAEKPAAEAQAGGAQENDTPAAEGTAPEADAQEPAAAEAAAPEAGEAASEAEAPAAAEAAAEIPVVDSLAWVRAMRDEALAAQSDGVKSVLAAPAAERVALAQALTAEDQQVLSKIEFANFIEQSAQQGLFSDDDLGTLEKAYSEGADNEQKLIALAQSIMNIANDRQAGVMPSGQKIAPQLPFDEDEPSDDNGLKPRSRWSRFINRDNSDLGEMLHSRWPGYDPRAGAVKYLDSYVDVHGVREVQNIFGTQLVFKVPGAGNVCWMSMSTDDGPVEFIGKTKGMSKFGKNPINEREADAIVAIAKMRGWQSLTVSGSAQEKNELWLAAMKQGLDVPSENFKPSDKYLAKWENYKQRNGITDNEHAMSAGVQENKAATIAAPEAAPAEIAAPKSETKPAGLRM